MIAEVTYYGIFDMQVCVPINWTDTQVRDFANSKNPSSNKWIIRCKGDKLLAGDSERVLCADRVGFVHIMLDC